MKREYEELFKQYCVPEVLFVLSKEGEYTTLALEISLQVSGDLIWKAIHILCNKGILISTGGHAGRAKRVHINPDHASDINEALEDYQRIKKYRFVLRDQMPKRKKGVRVRMAGKAVTGKFR
jgi:hypothetical protein